MKRTLFLAGLLIGCPAATTEPQEEESPQEAAASAEEAPAPTEEKKAMIGDGVDEAAFKKMHELSDARAPDPQGEAVEIAGATGYLSLPEGEGPHPGVVVIHEWWGLNDNIKYWADRLAAVGYAALAVDLYGGKVATNADDAASYMKSVEQSAANEILVAAHVFLGSDDRVRAPKVGSIGWCFGGGQSLQLAIAESGLDAAVMYYGFPTMDEELLGKIEAPILGIFANQDDFIPPDKVDAFAKALEKAGVAHTIHRYDAVHAFANPSNAKYDQAAAADAFEKSKAFFAEHLR